MQGFRTEPVDARARRRPCGPEPVAAELPALPSPLPHPAGQRLHSHFPGDCGVSEVGPRRGWHLRGSRALSGAHVFHAQVQRAVHGGRVDLVALVGRRRLATGDLGPRAHWSSRALAGAHKAPPARPRAGTMPDQRL